MGCAQSRIDNEESVSRCKERKILIKEALLARAAFTIAHSAYATALKNTGSALSDYGHGESTVDPVAVPPPPLPPEPVLPPPPPLSTFSPSPLQRSATMPEFPISKRGLSRMGSLGDEGENNGGIGGDEKTGLNGMAWEYFCMQSEMPGSGLDEIDEEAEEEDEEAAGPPVEAEEVVAETSLRPPETGIRQFVHSNTAPAEVGRETVNVSNSNGNSKVNLMEVLGEIDDYFLKASECAQEVTKLLEAYKLQCHSNHVDNKVPIDHAARVMQVITWNQSLKGLPESRKDEYEVNETLPTVLDKLMAWEKKLYEEVKASELMKMEYKRKVKLLNRQKRSGASAESLEKTKAVVSHVHTQYIVDLQSMDSTMSEVNELRDQQLYPKLVELVDGMAKMWENISMHHDSQLDVATELKSLDVLLVARETSKHHYQCTLQLSSVIQRWQEQFETLVNHQKHYVRSLNGWLKLNLIPVETTLREKISSPPRVQNPPIQTLLHAWHDCLGRLPDEVTKTAISSFGALIKTIILHQEEEMKLKESCEDLRKEYIKKNQAFENWYHKQMQRNGPGFMDSERGDEGGDNDLISEKRFVVESLKKRLDEELEKYQRHCVQVREKSLGTLKTRLPELFRALSEYAHACSDAYNKLN